MSGRAEKGATAPQELADFAARLQTAQRAALGAAREKGKESATKLGLAWRVSLELVAAVAVGGGLGLSLDSSLGTRPWFMVLFLLLGSAAGVLNVYRISQGLDGSVGFGRAKCRWEKRRW
ncbi:ATP synthase protein I [invertebrate metagenome]|uniref:ATP synthase protein I n=1 Tax=invertebrate metagenome TaxID=1711999 RepID=A0A484H5G9_9ZZZZ